MEQMRKITPKTNQRFVIKRKPNLTRISIFPIFYFFKSAINRNPRFIAFRIEGNLNFTAWRTVEMSENYLEK